MDRIYGPSVQKAFERSTGTVVETKAMALDSEIYQEILKSPYGYPKDQKITPLQLIDRYIDHCCRIAYPNLQWLFNQFTLTL